ncbi:ABC transporter ATP-binding protein [Algibacter amylolyticus]|uniref:ABC transporter ATP-binding protein n=1 Tax=Algibacter amylolyticus TaxID=1608400 RepID=A0A5M7BGC1_9FLAO|nr:ABC transporter ATP-binding protein [Algibacter amylolyticus]KAA5827507.1 ABC transporter ATP-binding protein [Algibacter amylolyticus]MBB5266708.1 ABC-type Fe3+/spermidine/putrescine transport system ATPase subunit [Algibacter amylolyticus]TSJ81752.1 ABC transporter ATP-binding protein [Algibacter amylolyticus]
MLHVKNLTFSYNKTPVLKAISFDALQGEHVAIIGESGSGKSTLLKVLYGEYDLDEGHVFWNDEEILGPKYNLVVGYDFMKYVAQEFDLMPFITVEENIGKFLSRFYPEEKQRRTDELLEVVELTKFAKTKVKTLSGGQKQRVALARALAKQPEIILLDEPFSHIDNFKKQSLRRSVFKYLKENNITCVVATHDKEDVLGFADRMIVLNDHKIAVNDYPETLFKNPKTPLIASFFGEFNVLNNKIIYAHQLRVVDKSDLKSTVKRSFFKGHYYLIEAELNGKHVFFEYSKQVSVGSTLFLKIIED